MALQDSTRGYVLTALLGLFLTCGCESGASPTSNASDSSAPGTAASARTAQVVRLDERMMATIKIAALSEKSFPLRLTTTGKVQFNEDQMARILAPVSGQVQQLRVKVGDRVRAEEPLFVINSREVAAAIDEYLESCKDADLAEKIYTMTKDLFEHKAASRMSLQQADSNFAKAKARVAHTEKALQVLGVEVRKTDTSEVMDPRIPLKAPLGGTIIERPVTEGQFVQPDSNALVTIADLSTVWVLADVFERDLHLVEVGQKAEVTTAAYPEQGFVAHVDRIGDVVDPGTRTVKVRFLVSNPGGQLKPEMFASVSLFLQESARALAVPAQAVFTEGGHNFVYVQTGEGEFVRRQVEAVANDGDLKILSGLQAGEQVVSNGALLLRLQEERQATD